MNRYVIAPGVSLVLGRDGDFGVDLPTGSLLVRGQTAEAARDVLVALTRERDLEQVAAETQTPLDTIERIVARFLDKGVVSAVDDLRCGLGDDPPADAMLRLFPRTAGPSAWEPGKTLHLACVGDPDLASDLQRLVDRSLDICTSIAAPDELPAGSDAPDGAILLTRTRQPGVVREVDSWASATSRPYVAGWFEGRVGILSHVVVPGRTACFGCLEQRELAAAPDNSLELREEFESIGRVAGPMSRLAAADALLVGAAALRFAAFLNGHENEAPTPTLLELDCATLLVTRHPIVRIPTCGDCGQ